MRYAIFFGIILIIGIAIASFWQSASWRSDPKSSPAPQKILDSGDSRMTSDQTETTETKPTTIIEYNNKRYAIFIQPITDPANLSLIPNFEQKKSSQDIMDEINCRYAINGGFYTTDNKPLGLFATEGKILSSTIESALLSGFFFKDLNNQLHITTDPPDESVSLALQSGPYFTPESVLKIRDDEYARRMLAAQDEQGKTYFIAITEEDSAHSGPLLGDLPNIIYELRTMNYELREALNLDGGSASAFYGTNGSTLSELTAIGSLLCGR